MIDVACYGEKVGLTFLRGVVLTLTTGGSSGRRHFELWFFGMHSTRGGWSVLMMRGFEETKGD